MITMKSAVVEKGGPVYFLLNISGLAIIDIRFTENAPVADSILLGGFVNAISSFSDNIMDNIAAESGTLNVIEREGMKIMFERGQEVEAILILDKESQIMMEKIRTIIDFFEHNYLERLLMETVQTKKYSTFRRIIQRFIPSHLDENIILKQIEQTNNEIRVPPKFTKLINAFDGKKSVIEVSRSLNWPQEYCLARTAMLVELKHLQPIDIAIKNTDIFEIDAKHVGILLEQGIAYRSIKRHWNEWGVKFTQKIDGRHTPEFLSANFPSRNMMQIVQLVRFLSLQGYIKLISDSDLLFIIFEEFLTTIHQQMVEMFGKDVTFTFFDVVLNQDLERAKNKGKVISVAKLVENYTDRLYFDKLDIVLKNRPKIMTPLFQNAFLPFLDIILQNLAKIFGQKTAMQLVQKSIVNTEEIYGALVYNILFTS
ncbi:hypothetical protein CEE45_16180 [Candidatus Heimdallarchaeota archaeon B3_Heim]|nr:MAG: hypothetical protein CEE45_16180 [Candidatus Heimdallarchaeota archaeon B3_Heim]